MKKRMSKLLSLFCAAVLVMGVFAGCSTQKKLQKVTVSEVTHSVFYAPQYAAIELGFFEEEGLELELSNGEGADKVMTAVLSGSVDIGFAGPEACIYVYNEGKEDYMQVFAQMTQRDGAFILAREADENFTWEKLKGKSLLPGRKGGVPYMTLEYVVKQHGMTPGVDVIFDDSIQFSAMAGAFISGTGDYVALFEPTASSLEAEGAGFIVASVGAESGEIPYTVIRDGKAVTKTVTVPNNYRLEVEQLGRCILEGARPHVSKEFSLLAARTTDRVLAAIGY